MALEAPIVIQGLLFPSSLPFLQLTNTAVVLLKVRSVQSFEVSRKLMNIYDHSFMHPLCLLPASLVCFASLFLVRTVKLNPESRVGLFTNDPEFLPGKRALAIGLCVYHSIVSTILYQAPRFIPHSFGPAAEGYATLNEHHHAEVDTRTGST